MNSRYLCAVCGLVFSVLAILPSQSFAALIHDYEFNGNLNDSLPTGISLAGNGTLSQTETGYTFSQNASQTGPALTDNASFSTNNSTYTISLSFKISDPIYGFEKILDFKNRTYDEGVYRYGDGTLGFYPYGSGTTVVASDTLYRVTVTRNSADNIVKGYVHDGTSFTTSFSYTDSGNNGVISEANTLWFLTNESSGSTENPSGYINQILVYNTVLDAGDVQSLGGPKPISPIPEPAAAGLVLAGGLWAVMVSRRRRAASRAALGRGLA